MRERCDTRAAARANHRVGGCESAVDHRGRAATVVHDLDETEGTADIDHTPERIPAFLQAMVGVGQAEKTLEYRLAFKPGYRRNMVASEALRRTSALVVHADPLQRSASNRLRNRSKP